MMTVSWFSHVLEALESSTRRRTMAARGIAIPIAGYPFPRDLREFAGPDTTPGKMVTY